jgi:serine/threonine protein kinase
MAALIHEFLSRAAYDGNSKFKFLSDNSVLNTQIGDIRLVKVVDKPGIYVIKTLDLDEQNVYAVTKDLGPHKKTLRGTHADHIKLLTTSRSDCKEWCEIYGYPKANIAKVCYIADTIDRDGAKTVLRGNEYINEALITSLMKIMPVPHYVVAHDAWIHRGKGHILMDFAGQPLMNVMSEFKVSQIQSITLQVLIALQIGLDVAHLKHHDVHLENVFVSHVQDQEHKTGDRVVALKSSTHWKYTLDGVSYYVPHCNLLAKLGDFGLASASAANMRFERVDYPHLNSGQLEWGAWNGKVSEQKSYDIVTYLTKFFLAEERSRVPDECVAWISKVWAALQELETAAGRVCMASIIGRPLADLEGNTSPKQLLAHSLFDSFRVPVEGALELY